MLPNWWSGHTQDHYLPGSEPPFSLPFNDICKNTNKILQDQTLPLYIKANGCPGAICIYGEQEEGRMITQRSTTSSDVILKHISCRVFKQLRPKVKHKQQVVLPLVQRDRSSQMRYRCLLLFLPPPWCALRHNLS